MLTEQKLKDKRYRKTEEAIVGAFFLAQDNLNPKKIIKVANISRATLYRHHKSVYNVVTDYKEYITRKYASTINKSINRGATLRQIFQRTLVFIIANRKIITFIQKFGDQSVIESMLYTLEPRVIDSHKVDPGEMCDIYVKETSAIIESWFSQGAHPTQFTAVISKLTYLTDTAKSHLGKICSAHVLQ